MVESAPVVVHTKVSLVLSVLITEPGDNNVKNFSRRLIFTYSVHIDDVLDKKITLKRVNAMPIDHNVKSASWTLELTAR